MKQPHFPPRSFLFDTDVMHSCLYNQMSAEKVARDVYFDLDILTDVILDQIWESYKLLFLVEQRVKGWCGQCSLERRPSSSAHINCYHEVPAYCFFFTWVANLNSSTCVVVVTVNNIIPIMRDMSGPQNNLERMEDINCRVHLDRKHQTWQQCLFPV